MRELNNYIDVVIEEANKAFSSGEVPIGAIVVENDKIIGRGHNTCKDKQNPFFHAEINAINDAILNTGRERLDGCSIYVNVEPCLMCFGAIMNTRFDNLYYFEANEKNGASCSIMYETMKDKLSHKIHIFKINDNSKTKRLLSDFFKDKR